jgi:hypothetical protein
VLHGHDGPLADKAVEAIGVDAVSVLAINAQAACILEAIE